MKKSSRLLGETVFGALVAAFVCAVAINVVNCKPAASPTSATITSARSATIVAMDAWNLASTACDSVSALAGGDSGVAIESKCATYLSPAHDLIAQAAQDVDDAADGGMNNSKIACNLVQAAVYMTQAASDPALKLPADVAAVLNDATVIAKAVLGSSACAAN